VLPSIPHSGSLATSWGHFQSALRFGGVMGK